MGRWGDKLGTNPPKEEGRNSEEIGPANQEKITGQQPDLRMGAIIL